MVPKIRHHTPVPPPEGQTDASPFPELEPVLTMWGCDPSALIEIMHAAQEHYGWLDRPVLGWLADRLRLPPSLVYGVAGFYHFFRLDPPALTSCSVCTGTSCHLKGGTRLLQTLGQQLGNSRRDTGDSTHPALEQVRCLGACGMAPLVRMCHHGQPPRYYHQVMPDRATDLLEDPTRLPSISGNIPPVEIVGPRDSRFVLSTCRPNRRGDGPVDYASLRQVVREITPDTVCRLISDSGLRGRGGGGYPTGSKWESVRRSPGRRKFVVANGDEGDPGAFMDRTLMEQDPHRILEGMAIAAYAVGASTGFIYVRGEYPLAAGRLARSIEQAEVAGMLGRNLFGTRFSFTVRVRIGAGAFVCGEETALMASIMGRRGQPNVRPPYPSEKGLWGQPTLINNVETFGAVAAIIADPAGFRLCGSAGNRGTKVFSVSGDVAVTGVVEVPLGTTVRELLAMVGGVTGGTFKAAQTGGASGGCIPTAEIDLPIDFESLQAIGTIMGSGGMVILNDKRCVVDLARFFMRFCTDESCGKCTPCRAGTRQALQILDRICSGTGDEADLGRLEELCGLMGEASLCGLGRAAPAPVLSTLRWYRDEYLCHIREHCCPAGVCNCGEDA